MVNMSATPTPLHFEGDPTRDTFAVERVFEDPQGVGLIKPVIATGYFTTREIADEFAEAALLLEIGSDLKIVARKHPTEVPLTDDYLDREQQTISRFLDVQKKLQFGYKALGSSGLSYTQRDAIWLRSFTLANRGEALAMGLRYRGLGKTMLEGLGAVMIGRR